MLDFVKMLIDWLNIRLLKNSTKAWLHPRNQNHDRSGGFLLFCCSQGCRKQFYALIVLGHTTSEEHRAGISGCYWKHCHWEKNYWEVLLGGIFKKNLNLLNFEESIGNISLATGAFVTTQFTEADQQYASWVLLELFHLLLLVSVSVCLSCVLFDRWYLWLSDSKTGAAF